MRPIKTFTLVALAAVAITAFAGATPALATNTQLCDVHASLSCEAGDETGSAHFTLAVGSILEISGFMSILCLGGLLEATPLGLDTPQSVHISSLSFTGCGFTASHSNCSLTVGELPLADLLKTGLDEGVLELQGGQLNLICGSLSINCLYDLQGLSLLAGAQHLTVSEATVTELGGKSICLDEGVVNGLLETLEDTYVLE